MAKELPFFKFNPTEWLTGKISYQPLDIQGAFIQCCSLFWKKSGVVKIDEIDWRIGKKNLEVLIENDFIAINEGFLSIEFLEEQLISFEGIRTVRAKNGQKGGVANATKSLANATEILPNVKQNVADLRPKTKDNNIINNSLLSEIKISDDKKFFLIKDSQVEINSELLSYFGIAVGFQKLFIKNLKEKNSPISQQENAKFKSYVDPIRLMIEKKEATKEQLQEAYKYLNSIEGEFWKSNILSTAKLREKLPILLAKKNTKKIIEKQTQTFTPDPNKRKRIA